MTSNISSSGRGVDPEMYETVLKDLPLVFEGVLSKEACWALLGETVGEPPTGRLEPSVRGMYYWLEEQQTGVNLYDSYPLGVERGDWHIGQNIGKVKKDIEASGFPQALMRENCITCGIVSAPDELGVVCSMYLNSVMIKGSDVPMNEEAFVFAASVMRLINGKMTEAQVDKKNRKVLFITSEVSREALLAPEADERMETLRRWALKHHVFGPLPIIQTVVKCCEEGESFGDNDTIHKRWEEIAKSVVPYLLVQPRYLKMTHLFYEHKSNFKGAGWDMRQGFLNVLTDELGKYMDKSMRDESEKVWWKGWIERIKDDGPEPTWINVKPITEKKQSFIDALESMREAKVIELSLEGSNKEARSLHRSPRM